MKAGDVVLASLAQADGQRKIRPALLLCQLPPFGDWLACGISSQLRHQVPGFDELITPDSPDFTASGLRGASVIRLGFVARLTPPEIGGVLGSVAQERLGRLSQNLAGRLHVQPGD